MKTTKIILILSFVLLQLQSFSQSNWDLWSGVKLSKDVYKGFSLSLNPMWRNQKNFTLTEFAFDTELKYAPFKHFDLTAKHRFIFQSDDENENENLQQFAIAGKAKASINELKFEFRLQFSNLTELDLSSEADYNLRYRFKTEYRIKELKLTPSFSVELFHDLTDSELDKIRYSLGAEYKIVKKNFISLEYHLQNYFNDNDTKSIFSIQYKLKL